MTPEEAKTFYDLDDHFSSLETLLEAAMDNNVSGDATGCYKMLFAMSTMLSSLKSEYIDLANSVFARQQQNKAA